MAKVRSDISRRLKAQNQRSSRSGSVGNRDRRKGRGTDDSATGVSPLSADLTSPQYVERVVTLAVSPTPTPPSCTVSNVPVVLRTITHHLYSHQRTSLGTTLVPDTPDNGVKVPLAAPYISPSPSPERPRRSLVNDMDTQTQSN